MNQFIYRRFTILLLLCCALFFFGNNLLHLTDPDEVFYSQTAREMLNRNEWVTSYIFNQPQFEKPVLTYWLIKTAFIAFGQTPFAARFFPAVFASFGVLGIYALGLLGFINEKRAFLAALVLCTSAFYVGMAKTVFTDMIFSVFILYALLSFYTGYVHANSKRLGILFFYLFAALATLTKGPLGLLIPLLVVVVFLMYRKQIFFLNTYWVLIGFVVYLLLAIPWYWYEISNYGQGFIQEFFYNDHWRRLLQAEHKGNDHWYFYPITMVAGLFPWSLFLIAALGDVYKRIKFSLKPFEYFLLSWILIVFIVFQVAHSKLASYILPMFPALALLTANYIDERIEEYRYQIIKRLSYVIIGFITVLGIVALTVFKSYKAYVPSILPAYFLSAGLLTIGGISLTLLFKERIRQGIILLGFCLAPVLMTAFMITSYLEPHVSMFEASTYIPSGITKSTILVSKPYARGLYYYTGHDVAVMDINGQNYFSPHPIPILNSNETLGAFLKKQPQTFAVLRKSSYEYLNKNFSKEYQVKVLKVLGRDYVLKIEPIKST